MVYSKAKLNSSGDISSPYFKTFWVGNISDNIYIYEI
jgi:hypothetical protein